MSTDRVVAACGILFAVLTVAGFLLLAEGQAGGEDTTLTSSLWIQERDHQVQWLVGMFLMSGGALAFLGLVSGVLVRMQRAGTPSFAVELGRLSGAGFAILQLVGAAGMASPAMILVSDYEGASSDAGLGRLATYGFITWQLAAFPLAALFVGVVSYAAIARQVFPRWLGLVGALCAVLLMLSFLFLPVLSLPIWTICVAAVVLVRRTESIPARANTVPA